MNVPLRGNKCNSDTAVVIIPINLLKQANAKMIERIYLININKEQDSIIIMKDKYIKEQQNIITDFQLRIDNAIKYNDSVKLNLEKQQKKNKVVCYSAGGVIIGLLISLIAK